MKLYRLSWPWSWLYSLAGRLGGGRRTSPWPRCRRPGSGITACLPLKGKLPRRDGVLILRLSWRELLAAIKLASLAIVSAGLLAAALYSMVSRIKSK